MTNNVTLTQPSLVGLPSDIQSALQDRSGAFDRAIFGAIVTGIPQASSSPSLQPYTKDVLSTLTNAYSIAGYTDQAGFEASQLVQRLETFGQHQYQSQLDGQPNTNLGADKHSIEESLRELGFSPSDLEINSTILENSIKAR